MSMHRITWFEIPVIDLSRAKRFYSDILQTGFNDVPAESVNMGADTMMAIFAYEGEDTISGALMQGPAYQPSSSGSVVYLHAGDDVQLVLDRVAAAGGEIMVAKTLIAPECGYYAIVKDSEGGCVGLHSMH